jgi:hypothetical protein
MAHSSKTPRRGENEQPKYAERDALNYCACQGIGIITISKFVSAVQWIDQETRTLCHEFTKLESEFP